MAQRRAGRHAQSGCHPTMSAGRPAGSPAIGPPPCRLRGRLAETRIPASDTILSGSLTSYSYNRSAWPTALARDLPRDSNDASFYWLNAG